MARLSGQQTVPLLRLADPSSVIAEGQPVEFYFTPGSCSDTHVSRGYAFDVPEGAFIIGDKVYNDYTMEDILHDAQLYLLPYRRQNTRRSLPPWLCYLQSVWRKVLETTGSLLERLLPKSIHTVTARGFELKVTLFLLAYSLSSFW